ncbi:hypothetical protein [Tenacibaculum soleae]|uniref:hypothetical protein n=1 Tax=Tenacibaculum soleae TaxID=447689 RepID=UPI002301336C|nr:hypothetical protein [Tenacibaculum soleae]
MLKDQETKVLTKIIGSIIIALSGLILFSDKVFTFQLTNNYGFKNTAVFLWVISQTLSPILMLIGSLFKPLKTAYLVPVYIYSIQLYWVFSPDIKFDDYFLQTYAFGACLGYMLLYYVIVRLNQTTTKKEQENDELKNEIKQTIALLKKKTEANKKENLE